MPFRRTPHPLVRLLPLALALVAGAGVSTVARAQVGFPRIPVWAMPGAWQDSTLLFPRRCPGVFFGPLPDSLRQQPRTITLRFHRDPLAEARPDFGGYRIYRAVQTPDTTNFELIRRYSFQVPDSLMWHFSKVDTVTGSPTYGQLLCGSAAARDFVVTFVDPDSTGSYQKVCRRVDHLDRCLSIGDSVFRLVAPPGPHDGFKTWYAVTYEAKNSVSNDFADLFVPDTTDHYSRCGTPGDPSTCPNLNRKDLNIIAAPVEPTAGPTPNLLRVAVVPNPYRASEAWDPAGGNEVHFINLPRASTIRIYTVAGDLVRVLRHDDLVRDFARWDLRNDRGQEVASGIYMYRVEAGSFTFQNRFIVIR